jgi:hypothetical protein
MEEKNSLHYPFFFTSFSFVVVVVRSKIRIGIINKNLCTVSTPFCNTKRKMLYVLVSYHNLAPTPVGTKD